MAVPRYIYQGYFTRFEDFLASKPHIDRHFKKGDIVWGSGDYIDSVFYIKRGSIVASVVHENGFATPLYFSRDGMVYPGCHETKFEIEKSIVTKALSDTEAYEYRRSDFHDFMHQVPAIGDEMLEVYARFINLHIYEIGHQNRNTTTMKLCNLLYVLSHNFDPPTSRIDFQQGDLASMLSMDRENVARCMGRLRAEGIVETHRGWVEIKDRDKLEERCSYETLNS